MPDKRASIKSHIQLQEALNHTKKDSYNLISHQRQLKSAYLSARNIDTETVNQAPAIEAGNPVEQPNRSRRLFNSISHYIDNACEKKCRKYLQLEIDKLIEEKKQSFPDITDDEIGLITEFLESIHARVWPAIKSKISSAKGSLSTYSIATLLIFAAVGVTSIVTGTFPIFAFAIGGIACSVAIYHLERISNIPRSYRERIEMLSCSNDALFRFVTSDKSFTETHREALESARAFLNQHDSLCSDISERTPHKKVHHRVKHHRHASIEKGTLFAKEKMAPHVCQESERVTLKASAH